jgi:hypothetical protein
VTVPVYHKGKFGQSIMDVEIDNSKNWRQKHWQSIKMCYSKAPYFMDYADFFENLYQKEWERLADLNIYLIENISSFLGINDTEFKRLSELNINNDNPTQRLIDICEKVRADKYIIGNRAKDYMEDWRWEKTDVKLEYFEPEYPSYPQLWGEYQEHCAIVDLLFNCGKVSGEYIWGKN